jgi:uncharacterized protein
MNTITSVVKRHPLITFFVLAYGISYTFYILSAIWPEFPFLYPFGSIIAALITASVTRGLDGLKDFASRCLRWRVGLRWYAAALLVPAAIGLAVVALNTLLGAPLPTLAQFGPWYGIFLMLPMAMIDAPLMENSGWHGYAMPRFPTNRSRLLNTLIIGVLLVGWHFPLTLAEPSIMVPYLLSTLASAFVTNWVYYNARESALLAILYHSAANTVGIFYSHTLAVADLPRYYWLLLAVNVVAAVTVVLFARKTWQSQNSVVQAHAEMVRGIS